MPDTLNLEEYKKRPSAVPLIVVVSFLLIAALAAAVWYRLRPFPSFGLTFPLADTDAADRLIFLCYVCAFAAVWCVYFASRSKNRLLRVRTLRLLLYYTSLNWGTAEDRIKKRIADEPLLVNQNDVDDVQLAEIESYFKDKARTSLQTMGMLIAVAALELGQINLMQNWAGKAALNDAWHTWTLGTATLAAIASFVMFVVATDSLDSLFNRFRGTVDRHKLIDHFYRKTINLRYFGLVSLLLGAVMIVANRNPILGATCFGMIFFFGCPAWFPSVKKETDVGTGPVMTFTNLIRVSVIIGPFILRNLIV